jgi:hypothetical protein
VMLPRSWVFTLLFVLCSGVASAQPPAWFGEAHAAVMELTAACRIEKQLLWGVDLCGPTILVEPGSRAAVLNSPDTAGKFKPHQGLYYGTLPQDLGIANTAVRWDDSDWTMLMVPLPQTFFTRIQLLAHESFHRVQRGLQLTRPDVSNRHLDSEEGRLWLRLELRALSAALRAEKPADRRHAADALLFRAMRRSLWKEAAEEEDALEIQEGLAEYTGAVVALQATGESLQRVARNVEVFEDRTSFVRSFAYATGPALGLLLDRFQPGWRKQIAARGSVSAVLRDAVPDPQAAAGGDRPASLAVQRASRYGYPAVAGEEEARARKQRLTLEEYRRKLVDGPVLLFPASAEMRRMFNPNNLVAFGELGTIYPTGRFTGPWGSLTVEDGSLVSPDNRSVRVSAPTDAAARPATGPGWTLELAPGWTIASGDRAGDFVVTPSKTP